MLSEPYHYIDQDEYETKEGKRKLRNNTRIWGVNVKLVSAVNIDDNQVREKFENLNFSYLGSWTIKKITEDAFTELTD